MWGKKSKYIVLTLKIVKKKHRPHFKNSGGGDMFRQAVNIINKVVVNKFIKKIINNFLWKILPYVLLFNHHSAPKDIDASTILFFSYVFTIFCTVASIIFRGSWVFGHQKVTPFPCLNPLSFGFNSLKLSKCSMFLIQKQNIHYWWIFSLKSTLKRSTKYWKTCVWGKLF